MNKALLPDPVDEHVNEVLTCETRVDASIVSIGDGLMLARKR